MSACILLGLAAVIAGASWLDQAQPASGGDGVGWRRRLAGVLFHRRDAGATEPRGPAPTSMRAATSTIASAAAPLSFTDVTLSAGIDFVETIGDDEMSNIVEATGVGCGFLDYDGDGWMDIYLVNGCWRAGVSDPKLDADKRERLAAATDRLYRNRGDGTFEDVTARAGITQAGYGMAVVAADYDADGDTDIYVTNDGPNFLYRNNGDGTFTECAKAAGVDDPAFSVGAVFFDYDGDGRLDLYVGNYVTYVADAKGGHTAAEVRSPLAYEGQQDRLYRNNGDGTFTDVTRRAGLETKPAGRAMGVGTIDYDEDGGLDIFVANDAMENFLWRNNGDGTFTNEALLAGVAFGETGAAAASMAVEVGDYDGDGRFDLFVPDMNGGCLYRNLSGGMFEDAATRSGIGPAMIRYHGWGAAFGDFDLDGDLDVYIANGNACRLEAQPDGLFVNNGDGRFTALDVETAIRPGDGRQPSTSQPATTQLAGVAPANSWCEPQAISLCHTPATSGPANAAASCAEPGGTGVSPVFPATGGTPVPHASRGVARADFDNDGDLDLLVASLNDRPVLLRNDTPRGERHWLEVMLVGRGGNRDAIGAVVKVTVGGRTIVRHRASAGSYLSQHDPRLHFGLGPSVAADPRVGRVDRLEVVWPDGSRQEVQDIPTDRLVTVRQDVGERP